MVALDMKERERTALVETLETAVSDLSMEIAGTDRLMFREQLKERRQHLMHVLRQLRHEADVPVHSTRHSH